MDGVDTEMTRRHHRHALGDIVGKRILVGYATRTGSTGEVAQAIGQTLVGRGYEVDVTPLAQVLSLAGYDAAILGSAINGAQWLPEARSFVRANSAALQNMPVSLYCVHAMNTRDTGKCRAKRTRYLDKVRSAVTPVDEGYFAGVGPKDEDMSATARWFFKAFGGDVEGDGRDWEAIRAWAQTAHV
jgi:menaquinone-dependent protoporphyrinogen oxidase